MKKMSKPDKDFVSNIIFYENFEYAFENYTSFDEVEDPYFHELRLKYLESLKNLKSYIEYGG